MPVNISEFRAVLNQYNGLAKPNKFRLRLPIPTSITNFQAVTNQQGTRNTVRYLEYFCTGIDLPGASLASRQIVRYGYGVTEKKPAFTLFNDIALQFLNDTSSINLQFFQDWILSISHTAFYNTINDSNVNFGGQQTAIYELGYMSEYAVEAELNLLNEHGEITQQYKLRNFYPAAIQETRLSWDSNQQMMVGVVLFSFTDWYYTNHTQAQNAGLPSQPNAVSSLASNVGPGAANQRFTV